MRSLCPGICGCLGGTELWRPAEPGGNASTGPSVKMKPRKKVMGMGRGDYGSSTAATVRATLEVNSAKFEQSSGTFQAGE